MHFFSVLFLVFETWWNTEPFVFYTTCHSVNLSPFLLQKRTISFPASFQRKVEKTLGTCFKTQCVDTCSPTNYKETVCKLHSFERPGYKTSIGLCQFDFPPILLSSSKMFRFERSRCSTVRWLQIWFVYDVWEKTWLSSSTKVAGWALHTWERKAARGKEARLQNIGPLIYILMNNNRVHFFYASFFKRNRQCNDECVGYSAIAPERTHELHLVTSTL